jgi:carboxymethylenebutenolidase
MEVAMQEKEIRVKTADGEMRTFVVHPDGAGPFPVAVLYMDGVGYRDQVKDNARRFAAAGYYVVAPDLYYRSGEGLTFDMSRLATSGPDDPERQRMMQAAMAVQPAKMVDDTEAVFKAIAADPVAGGGPKVCVGYCLGARMSLHAASAIADEVVAAASIHPGAFVTDKPDSPHHDLDRVRGEIYVAFAENDRTATPESVEQFRSEMHSRGVRGEVERLPGTTHGFAMADLPVYNRDAAEHHFEKVLDLWGRNLTRAPANA